MNNPKIPQIDSIEELARFWDTHDLSDFEDELEEVTEPVFERTATVKTHLQPKEMEALKETAQTRGLSSEDLIREWILEKMGNS